MAVLEQTWTSYATSAALQWGVFSVDSLTARRHLSEGPDGPEREAVDSLPLLVNCTITRLTVQLFENRKGRVLPGLEASLIGIQYPGTRFHK